MTYYLIAEIRDNNEANFRDAYIEELDEDDVEALYLRGTEDQPVTVLLRRQQETWYKICKHIYVPRRLEWYINSWKIVPGTDILDSLNMI